MGTMPCLAYILQRLQQPQPCPRAGVLGSSVFSPSIVSLISNCDKHKEKCIISTSETSANKISHGIKPSIQVDIFSERVLSSFYVIYVNTVFTFLTYWYNFKHRIEVCMIVTGPIWNKTILSVVHHRVDPGFHVRKATLSFSFLVTAHC